MARQGRPIPEEAKRRLCEISAAIEARGSQVRPRESNGSFYRKFPNWYSEEDRPQSPPAMRASFPTVSRPRFISDPNPEMIARMIKNGRASHQYPRFFMFVVGDDSSNEHMERLSKDYFTKPRDRGLFFATVTQQSDFLQTLARTLNPGFKDEMAIPEVGYPVRGISNQPTHSYVTVRERRAPPPHPQQGQIPLF